MCQVVCRQKDRQTEAYTADWHDKILLNKLSPAFTIPQGKSATHLNLTWSNVELLQNVDEESLHFIPGVDGVWTIQNDHDVHVGLTSWATFNDKTSSWEHTWKNRCSLMSKCNDPVLLLRAAHECLSNRKDTLLWKAGAIVLENLKLALTLEQMPVL